MLCSNPLVIKAKRHQNVMISFALSLFVRKPDQTARQTSMLQRMPRRKSLPAGADILASAAVAMKGPTGSEARPVPW